MAQNPELHLWRTVLVQALRDAARAGTPQDARWPMTRDFVAVCHLAQVDPEAVRRGRQDAVGRRRYHSRSRPAHRA